MSDIETVAAAARDVFETMVFRQLERVPSISGDARTESNVVASVAFTGRGNGVISLFSSMDTARAIAGLMLGIPPQEVNGELPDAIGEVTNMIAGGFRNRMLAHGEQFEIAVPTITTGSNLSTSYTSVAQRATCAFRFEGRRLFVELALIQNRGA